MIRLFALKWGGVGSGGSTARVRGPAIFDRGIGVRIATTLEEVVVCDDYEGETPEVGDGTGVGRGVVGIGRVLDPGSDRDRRALRVDETSYLRATKDHPTIYATGLVDLDSPSWSTAPRTAQPKD